MKTTKLILTFAIAGLLFTACDDTKKKEAEAAAAAEKIEMEAQAEAERLELEAKAEFDKNTIAAIAMGNESFTTLVSALKAADLASTFMAEGEYTVFAPTNEAFAKVPSKTLESLMKPENKASLQNILKYHVVAGEWNAEAVIKAINDNNNAYTVTTLQGEDIVLSLKNDKVMIKDAKGKTSTVVTADVDASNGVIHIIDAVIQPK